jgi:hypothetical protein
MSQFGPYSASKAAPAHRQPCNCGRPIGKDGRVFPHKRTKECDAFDPWIADPEFERDPAFDRDLIDESREQEARHQNYLSGR